MDNNLYTRVCDVVDRDADGEAKVCGEPHFVLRQDFDPAKHARCSVEKNAKAAAKAFDEAAAAAEAKAVKKEEPKAETPAVKKPAKKAKE